jgi:FtsZ-binding cell division protein ZapB
LKQERAEAAKASLAPSDRQVLLAKVEENATLIDSNRLLRDEKKGLEEKLIRKVEDLTAATLKLDPLQQDLYNLRSEIDLLKAENTHLTSQVSTWRTRATTLTTKVRFRFIYSIQIHDPSYSTIVLTLRNIKRSRTSAHNSRRTSRNAIVSSRRLNNKSPSFKGSSLVLRRW